VTARDRLRRTAIPVAIVAAIAYAVLGSSVSHGAPGAFDLAAKPLAGQAVPVAWFFTASCLWPVLVTYGVVALVLAATSRAWRARALFSVAVTVIAWQTSDVLKDVFRRPRPAYWVFHHEPSFSYSSGHAMFATIVYALWAYFVARSSLPRAVRVTLAPLLAAWGCAVIWSRLALGAHYPTDLIGGVLLGAVFLAAGAALVPRIAERPA
jgi:undecaprenyl-diphosphatase